MAQQINDTFELLAGLPIDNRIVKPTISERDLISSTRRYQGLQCFVNQTQTLYMLIGGIANSNWIGIAGANASSDIETVIEGFYVLSAGKENRLDWEVGDKFRGWISNRYVVGEILSLPVSLPSDIDNTGKVKLAIDSDFIDNFYQPNMLISATEPTRSGNTFTFPANGYVAIINKTQRTNPAQFVTTITEADDNYKRVDLIWFKDDNTFQKTVGVQSLNVAVRPEIPVGQIGVPVSFINVFGDVIDSPTPIVNEISIQNAQGEEQFRVPETGYIRFRNVSFNSSNKEISIDALTPYTVFIDSVNGSDTMGQLENKDKPFKTDVGAYNALPADDGSEWNLLYIDSGVTRSMVQIPNRNLKIQCFGTGTFNWNIVATSMFVGTSKTLTIDAKKCTLSFTNTGASIFSDTTNSVNIFADIITVNADVTGGISGWFRGSLNLEANTFTVTTDINMFGCNGVATIRDFRTSVSAGGGSLVDNGVTNLILNINKITKLNAVALVLCSGNTGTITFNIREITGSGTVTFKAAGTKTIDINLTNFTFDSGINVTVLGGNAGGRTTIRGTSSYSRVLNFVNGAGVKNVLFENFIGRTSSLPDTNINTYTFNNVTMEVATSFLTGSSINSVTFNGSNYIASDTPNFLFTNVTTPSVFTVKGTLRTNFLSYGVNVSVIEPGLTFKEKEKEIVIRSKFDLINKVLDSEKKYIIDGSVNLVLVSGEYIIVPANGLDIGGYGFDVSSISKNVAGQSIFTSPSGGSGNFVSNNMSYYAGLGSVFDITDSNETHAIELNDINFQGVTGSSIGSINGYRQFTGTTCGLYNLSNGFVLDGNWSGFKLTNTNIIGFSSSGTLFKKGTDLEFSNRFFAELNLQIATGSIICDFEESNFVLDKSLQIVNCFAKVNGVIDPLTTSATFPNISPFSPKAYFLNNQGISNSRYVVPSAVNDNEAVNLGQIKKDYTVSTNSDTALANDATTVYYTYTDSGTTNWELPVISGNKRLRYVIINFGGTITLKSNVADSNGIWDSGTAVASIPIVNGGTMEVYNNGLKYIIL